METIKNLGKLKVMMAKIILVIVKLFFDNYVIINGIKYEATEDLKTLLTMKNIRNNIVTEKYNKLRRYFI